MMYDVVVNSEKCHSILVGASVGILVGTGWDEEG